MPLTPLDLVALRVIALIPTTPVDEVIRALILAEGPEGAKLIVDYMQGVHAHPVVKLCLEEACHEYAQKKMESS